MIFTNILQRTTWTLCVSSLLANGAYSEQQIYWTDYTLAEIKHADLDGSDISTILDSADGLFSPSSLAVDLANQKVYWTDTSGSGVSRANIDGSSVELIASDVSQPLGVVLDAINGKVYWTQGSLDRDLHRSNLDGSNNETLIDNINTGGPLKLAIDSVNGKIYYTDTEVSEVRRANLDGSSIETVIAQQNSFPLAIVVDPEGGKIYWSDSTFQNIQRADLSGSNVEEVATSVNVDTLALDLDNKKLYWTDITNVKIQRADFDGSNLEDVLTSADGLSGPAGIVVFGEAPVLNPVTTIEEAPVVEINERSITLILQDFSDVTLETPAKVRELLERTKAAEGPLTFRYDVRLIGEERRKAITKRNEITFKNLKPGSYSANYRAIIYTKRSKAQKQKAVKKGRTGFDARYRKVAATDFSPSATFDIE